jgi:hypothetical protein
MGRFETEWLTRPENLAARPSGSPFLLPTCQLRSNLVAARLAETKITFNGPGIRGMWVKQSRKVH